ncbi:MAG: peptidoglycan editing factor PgeF [Firmicutes bacterium]|nr:peptidoglycan editing factor PgeF [Bacillota bacterium]
MAWEIQESNGVRYCRSQLLAAFPWLKQGFSTRCPVPETRAEAEAEQEYRRRFLALFQLTPDQTQLVKQVHGDTVLIVAEPRPGQELPEADAMITNRPGVGLATVHADCVPVVLVDPVHRVIAAVHAGWKGTLAGLVRKTVARMGAEYGSVPEECYAAIGPAIGSCCYRVPPERIALFTEKWPEFAFAVSRQEATLDLPLINQKFLENCGLRPEHIDNARLCTACHHRDFYSFRREQATGRMLSLVVMK